MNLCSILQIKRMFTRRLCSSIVSASATFTRRKIMKKSSRKRKSSSSVDKKDKQQNNKVTIRSKYFEEALVANEILAEASSNCANGSRLQRQSFTKDGSCLAKDLLGKIIHRKLENGVVLSGRIVETEAYLGEIDKACHTYGGKRTKRTEAMYMQPGTAYVYFIYGMYYCLNISSSDKGGCVLIRALEPLQGNQEMQQNRRARRKTDNGKPIPVHMLCNGPSKLCTALNITKEKLNKEDMATSSVFWVEEDSNFSNSIVTSTRIGIDSYGPEWAMKPLRFYVMGSKAVSVRDKTAESNVNET